MAVIPLENATLCMFNTDEEAEGQRERVTSSGTQPAGSGTAVTPR